MQQSKHFLLVKTCRTVVSQGELQGPFLSTEMAEWFRAAYFNATLLVKRLCDDSFYMLGDLVQMCSGNPFQTNMHIAPLKQEVPVPDSNELLQYQLLQRQLALRQMASMRAMGQSAEHWSGLPNMQQRDLVNQPVLTHPQVCIMMVIIGNVIYQNGLEWLIGTLIFIY